MRTLYLHVGQDKTGSSYIQSALVNSLKELHENKLFYPVNRKILLAKEGKISSGNAGLLSNSELVAFKDLEDNESILISGEQLFRLIPQDDFLVTLNEFKNKYNIGRVKCLLYIREPMEHLSSAYQQAIKRGGYSGTIEEFAPTYMHTKKVYNFVKFCNESKDFELKIFNYSKRKNKLIESFEIWLGIKQTTLKTPEIKTVNRSLTRAELEFQRIVNVKLGKVGSFVSDALCETLPQIKSEKVNVPIDLQKIVLKKLTSFCEYIDRYSINEGESDTYSMDFIPEEKFTDNYSFSAEQIGVIAEAMHVYYSNTKVMKQSNSKGSL
ncbi:hypothetical protein [Shewanella sp. TC10]|uniref:hypothetical protein n=1 Tax=Shewanella sp. TC10 TaxID=1419739 RepID=UPI00129DBCA9|nr:hypothetical protein [Shewanella sp. TC10]